MTVIAQWQQPYQSGLLMAFDNEAEWQLPDDWEVRDAAGSEGRIRSSPTCLCVPVHHAQDIDIPDDMPDDEVPDEAQVAVTVLLGAPHPEAEFVGTLACPTGRMSFGDAEESQVLSVPVGDLEVSVTRQPTPYADAVTVTVQERT